MIGCFGKIPAKADFIGFNASCAVIQELDRWLQNALLRFLDHDDWQPRFDALPVCFFTYRAQDGRDVMGAMISSLDAAERRYPFFIFQVLKAEADDAVSPCIHTMAETFAGQVRQILTDSVHGNTGVDPVSAVQEMRALNGQDLALYERIYARFLSDYSFDDVARSLKDGWPEFVSGAFLYRLHYALSTWADGGDKVIVLPLPAERGLKRPVADLWQQWAGKACTAATPFMSLLIDDFMRPKLLLMPIRERVEQFYEVLSNPCNQQLCIDLLSPFSEDEQHPGNLSLPDTGLSLAECMDCFPPRT